MDCPKCERRELAVLAGKPVGVPAGSERVYCPGCGYAEDRVKEGPVEDVEKADVPRGTAKRVKDRPVKRSRSKSKRGVSK